MNLGIASNRETGGATCAAHWALGIMIVVPTDLC